MNDIFDVLETCLRELENGADVESVLARYPHLASELRPILKASVAARMRSVDIPAPSPEVVRRGRAKLLQHAAQMREAKSAPRKRAIPIFQRLAIAVTLAALFLTSGTGLVSASSSALPGENLYPVKLTWENVRLFFTFNEEYRKILEFAFENERLHEVGELLAKGRRETIRFAGVYMEVNDVTYVSGVHVVVLDTSSLPIEPLLNGAAVVVRGRTNAEGFVDVESIELLPDGTVVPMGEPIEVEDGHENNGGYNRNENDNHQVDNENNENTKVDDANDMDSNDNDSNFNDNENSNDNEDETDADNENNNHDSNDDNNNDDSKDDNDNDDSKDDGDGGKDGGKKDDGDDDGGGGGDDD